MRKVKNILIVILGSLISSFGISVFLSPNHIAVGGASGIAIALNTLFNVPISLTVVGINLVLFTIGFKFLDKSSLGITILATLLFSFVLELVSYIDINFSDRLLSSIFGGAFLGYGIGLVISTGATTGGSDFASLLLYKLNSHISLSFYIFIIDFSVVVISSLLFKSFELLLYGFIALFVTSKAVEFALSDVHFSKLVYIITDKKELIVDYILNTLERGVTSIDAKGEYSQNGKDVLMCVISQRQFARLKNYLKTNDENAFNILTSTQTVFGKGFNIQN